MWDVESDDGIHNYNDGGTTQLAWIRRGGGAIVSCCRTGRRDKHLAMAARLASLDLREDLTYPELKLRSLKLTNPEICDFLSWKGLAAT